ESLQNLIGLPRPKETALERVGAGEVGVVRCVAIEALALVRVEYGRQIARDIKESIRIERGTRERRAGEIDAAGVHRLLVDIARADRRAPLFGVVEVVTVTGAHDEPGRRG